MRDVCVSLPSKTGLAKVTCAPSEHHLLLIRFLTNDEAVVATSFDVGDFPYLMVMLEEKIDDFGFGVILLGGVDAELSLILLPQISRTASPSPQRSTVVSDLDGQGVKIAARNLVDFPLLEWHDDVLVEQI